MIPGAIRYSKPKDFLGRHVRVETYGFANHVLNDQIGFVISEESDTHCLVEFTIDGQRRTFAVNVFDLVLHGGE